MTQRSVPIADYVDPGHPGVWPDGEDPRMRDAYDQMLAEQNAFGKARR